MHGSTQKRHSFRERRVRRELQERKPALIDLPFALPSIPIINPLVTKLIGQSTPTKNTPPPLPAPTPPTSGEGQVLTIPAPAVAPGHLRPLTGDEPPTPMSVRPFSPSESFAFPKPPSSSRPTSMRNSVMSDPFADPLSAWAAYPALLSPGASSANPFADDASPPPRTSASSSVVEGAEERVCRPFAPTLHDEVAVATGDVVTVVQPFDDGWVRVRRVDGADGLIPLDCFRQAGEDLPAFLASKRVSSFMNAAKATA
ncbi:hypothetical protein BC834DRAFT_579720 [Gloeopeniophorella convolvens]|nr:hypothetical protein BC834DRAFT_579720 [Gloeopeniophorella convolvens]